MKLETKTAIFVILMVFIINALTGCASTPEAPAPKGFALPVALSEVYRGGTLAPMMNAESPDLGMPSQYDLVPHVCKSYPQFDMYNRYVRTDVRCW